MTVDGVHRIFVLPIRANGANTTVRLCDGHASVGQFTKRGCFWFSCRREGTEVGAARVQMKQYAVLAVLRPVLVTGISPKSKERFFMSLPRFVTLMAYPECQAVWAWAQRVERRL